MGSEETSAAHRLKIAVHCTASTRACGHLATSNKIMNETEEDNGTVKTKLRPPFLNAVSVNLYKGLGFSNIGHHLER